MVRVQQMLILMINNIVAIVVHVIVVIIFDHVHDLIIANSDVGS
jgi:hypothetical protein